MKILISGGTGFIGSHLCNFLQAKGHEIRILTRHISQNSTNQNDQYKYYYWNPQEKKIDLQAFDDLDAIINLAGENLAQRWTKETKHKIKKSRIECTEFLRESYKLHSNQKLQVFIQASAIGYYKKNMNRPLSEYDPPGKDFLSTVCQDWEEEAKKFHNTKRIVIGRFGLVLGKNGGLVHKILPFFKMGLGGKVGNGKQYMSWIHIDDLVNFIHKALNDEDYIGPYNVCSPNPVTNDEFTYSLARVLRKPHFLKVPKFGLKLILGEAATLALDSQNIKPRKLELKGFHYNYPDITEALYQICKDEHGHVKEQTFVGEH